MTLVPKNCRFPVVVDFWFSGSIGDYRVESCVIGEAFHAGGTESGEEPWWWGEDPAELAVVFLDHAWDGDEAAFLKDLPRLIAHEVLHGLIYMALGQIEVQKDHWAIRKMGL